MADFQIGCGLIIFGVVRKALASSFLACRDMPGLRKTQMNIGIEGDVVRVTSKAGAPRSAKAAGGFAPEIDVATRTAKLEPGLWTLTLGKKTPVSNVARLAIQ